MALQRIAAPSLPILTSLNGTKRTGVPLQSDVYQIGTLILECACVLPTTSVVATFGVEGSVDGTTFVAIKDITSIASVTLSATGTVATSGFRVIYTPLLNELAEKLPPYYLGDTYEALVSSGRAGYRIKEIPAPLMEREHGKSSARPIKAARLTVKAILSAVLHVHHKLNGPTTIK